MNVNSGKAKQEIAADFFKAPNGTFLCEKGEASSYTLCAVKLPLGGEERFSVVMAESLYKDQTDERGIFPERRWKMEVDSFVDNETGKRVISHYSSDFEHHLGYVDGIRLAHAIEEVEQAVHKNISAMTEENLMICAIANGDNPELAMVLDDNIRSRIIKDCERAFVGGYEPECLSDENSRVNLDIYDGAPQARFALAYLKDKKALIREKTTELAPGLAAGILRDRMIRLRAEMYMDELETNPRADLIKEREIRSAIQGKASVWATFGKGSETLRISVPIDMFRSGEPRLNTYALTNKEGRRLEQLLKDPDSWNWNAYVSDIVALDYKGKTLYRDEAFYGQQHTNNQSSFDAVLKDAQTRAGSSQPGMEPSKEPTR